jgi:hypothetical protein
MEFDAEFIHRPGKYNPADYHSRHPVEGPGSLDSDVVRYIAFVTQRSMPGALTRDELIRATAADEGL